MDAAIAGLFQGGLRRSEAAALTWGDVQDAPDGRGILVRVRRSKTDQDGTAADVRYLKNGAAAAVRQLRDRITVRQSGLRPEATDQVLGGLGGQSIALRAAFRRLQVGAPAGRRRPGRSGPRRIRRRPAADGARLTRNRVGGRQRRHVQGHRLLQLPLQLAADHARDRLHRAGQVAPPRGPQCCKLCIGWYVAAGCGTAGEPVQRAVLEQVQTLLPAP